MTLKQLIELNLFEPIHISSDTSKTISQVFCCDLLSIAMSRAPMDSAWVTVMGNINTLAVATLCDTACIILAEGTRLDDTAAEKAKTQDLTVLRTDLPIFEAALMIHQKLNA